MVLTFTAMATLAVLLRTSIEASQKETTTTTTNESGVAGFDPNDDRVELRIQDASAYEFLISYALELVLALFLYYPVVGSVLFSGYLGCGAIPILGGRPYEVKMEERRKQRRRFQAGNSDDTDSYLSDDRV